MRYTVWLVLFIISSGCGTEARTEELPEYDSENGATSVRESVLGSDGGVPESIVRSELEKLETTSSGEVQQLASRNGVPARVHGVVASTFVPVGGGPVILNFGDDFGACFKVVIFGRNYDHWNLDADEIASLYDGAELLVEGTISIYDDLPQIEIISPSQVRRVVDE